MKVVTSKPESDTDLAAQFASKAKPLFDMLFRGAWQLTRSDVDAEDLLQDTLMHAYAGFHTFSDGTNFKAWLFRILHNRWISGHRSKQCRPAEVFIDGIAEWVGWDGSQRLADAPRSAEANFLDAVPNPEIKSAMAMLPEGSRTAIYYTDVLGYSYAETAAVMDIPIGTVMSRVSRGRKRLRFALGHLTADVAVLEPDIA